ncbi:MAG: ParB/RepB/Spo0J family partition protein [Bacteroidetes bacterium]|nr:ParB/RepB/Spo0J family partition protein [Bacteroidota bacterium]
MTTNKKKALGRGLSAILASPDTDITSRDISGDFVAGAVANIPLDKIEPNPFQPREGFDMEPLKELAQSIISQGIIQPLTVRKLGYDKYQIIAGERRFKAAKIAGLASVPCFIRVANDEEMLEMALIENIHRENLNPLDIAISLQRLIDECNLRHEEVSEKIGKERSTVTNYLRLLKLPAEIQAAIRDQKITMGHARALINIEDATSQLGLLDTIFRKKLSVRQVEELVRQLKDYSPLPKRIIQRHLPESAALQQTQLREKYRTDIEIRISRKGKGSIVFPFQSEEELDQLINNLNR